MPNRIRICSSSPRNAWACRSPAASSWETAFGICWPPVAPGPSAWGFFRVGTARMSWFGRAPIGCTPIPPSFSTTSTREGCATLFDEVKEVFAGGAHLAARTQGQNSKDVVIAVDSFFGQALHGVDAAHDAQGMGFTLPVLQAPPAIERLV